MPIEIREAQPEDARAIQAIYAPIVSGTAISFEGVPQRFGRGSARLCRPTRIGLPCAISTYQGNEALQ